MDEKGVWYDKIEYSLVICFLILWSDEVFYFYCCVICLFDEDGVLIEFESVVVGFCKVEII